VYSYPQINDEKLCKRFSGLAYGAGAGAIFRLVPSPEIPLDTALRNLGMCKLRQKSRRKRTLQPRAVYVFVHR